MIAQIIKQWEERKEVLRKYFSETPQSEYDSYKSILTKILELVVTEFDEYDSFDITKMTVIDDGDYQGTKIFIMPKSTYQPSIGDYIVTHTYYGSCSGCDTLQGISSYDDGLPNIEQVNSYMTLSLHLVQRMKFLCQEND